MQLPRELERKPGLADPARADQAEEAAVSARQHVPHALHVPLTADQGCGGRLDHRHGARPSSWRCAGAGCRTRPDAVAEPERGVLGLESELVSEDALAALELLEGRCPLVRQDEQAHQVAMGRFPPRVELELALDEAACLWIAAGALMVRDEHAERGQDAGAQSLSPGPRPVLELRALPEVEIPAEVALVERHGSRVAASAGHASLCLAMNVVLACREQSLEFADVDHHGFVDVEADEIALDHDRRRTVAEHMAQRGEGLAQAVTGVLRRLLGPQEGRQGIASVQRARIGREECQEGERLLRELAGQMLLIADDPHLAEERDGQRGRRSSPPVCRRHDAVGTRQCRM